jgi:non-heme chloroperoxidase
MTDWKFRHASLSGGPRLHYAEYGDSAGRPIVLLHGWPDSWFSYSRLVPLLPGNFRAFVLDQRGFGESERPARGYGMDEFAADVVRFLDAVGVARSLVVGHSFGSFVARQVAATYPERVERLVLIGTGFSASNPVTREVQASIRELSDPVPRDFARDFQASTAYVRLPEAFFDRIVSESLKLPAYLWREIFDQLLAHHPEPALSHITTPTLLMWGDRDALFSREDQDRLLAAIRGAQLTIYVETGHCPNWERPERVAADLAAFAARR